MFGAPDSLTSTDWQVIHNWLVFLWVFFPLVIIAAFSLLTAHAFIPSMIETGHLPERVSRVRLPMTILALVVGAGAVALFLLAIATTFALESIWGRWLI